MRDLLRLAAASAVAAFVLALGPGVPASAADCDDPEDGEPPYAVWVEGQVTGLADGRLRVGDAVLVVDPASLATSPGGDDEGPDQLQTPAQMRRVLARLAVGDGIYAEGTLAPDATVRVGYIERDSGIGADSAPICGIVRDVGPGTLLVDDDLVNIEGRGDFTTRYDSWTSLEGLRTGDVVFVAARRGTDGTLVGSEGTYRMSGRGSVLEGTITAVDLTDDPQVQVGGVWCVLDGHDAITGLGGGPCEFGGDDLRAGWTIRARGVLRDGRLLADAVNVVSKRDGAKRRARTRGWGYVRSAEAGRIDINGLALTTGARAVRPAATRMRRGAARLRAAPGQRVGFSARFAAGRGLVTTRLARR